MTLSYRENSTNELSVVNKPIYKSPKKSGRYEVKYILSDESKNSMLHHLHTRHNTQLLRDAIYPTSYIQSLYFDTSDLLFYRHHVEMRKRVRYKLRVRQYGFNGVIDSSSLFLELKWKIENVSKKIRVRISERYLQMLKSYRSIPLDKEVIFLNPHIEIRKLENWIRIINLVLKEYKLQPTLLVTYYRNAYKLKSSRITIDAQVRSKFIGDTNLNEVIDKIDDSRYENILNKYNYSKNYILEIKCAREIPYSLLETFKKINIEKTSFSKYCFGIMSTCM